MQERIRQKQLEYQVELERVTRQREEKQRAEIARLFALREQHRQAEALRQEQELIDIIMIVTMEL